MDVDSFVKSLMDDVHQLTAEMQKAQSKWAGIQIEQLEGVITAATHAEFCGLFSLALVAQLSDVTYAKVTSTGDIFNPVTEVDWLGVHSGVHYPLPFLAARAAEYLLPKGKHPDHTVRSIAVLIFDTLHDERMPLSRQLGRELTVALL